MLYRQRPGPVAVLVVLVLLVAGSLLAAEPAATPPPAAGAPSPAGERQGADPSALETGRDRYSVVVTEEMREHQRWEDSLYFAGVIWSIATLVLVLGLGISRRLRDLAARFVRRPWLAAMVYFALFSLVSVAFELPLDYLGGFVIPHRFALSDQGLGGWLWDRVKELLLGVAIGAPITALALAGIRRIRRWWLALWLGAVPLTIFFVLIAPVVLDPVFNDFKPLRDEQLRTELLDLARRAGIESGRVYEVDRSKQTKTMNAYVNGLGPTKRIVLWDTIIAKMDHDELRFVMAHEMGHYVLHHVWKGLGFILAVMFAVFWMGQHAAEWATRRWGRRWGFHDASDPAAVPLLFLVLTVFFFLLTPVINGYSRTIEHQSDIFALELTRLNDAGARAFVKFAEDSKVLPDPSPFIRFWRYSHPTLAERIAFCRSYAPWEKGEPNRVWRSGSGGR